MINAHQLKVVDSGSGFTIGEIQDRPEHLRYLKGGAIVCLFDGVDTALDYIGKNMQAKRDKSSELTGRARFNAFGTYQEAMETFRSKPETITNFDATEIAIKDVNESGTSVDYDVTGDYIDMGRYMEGIPETFGSMHSGNARNRRVNIIIDAINYAGMDAKDIQHRGERVLRLIDALEAGGVRTELTSIASNECGHVEIKVKRHDEPLVISDLAIVSHSEYLRRIIFRVYEQSKTWDDGYGSGIIFSQSTKSEALVADNNNELNILINGNISRDIDRLFDSLERLLVWEMSKPVPEMTSVKVDREGVWFDANGARGEAEIKREGQEIINEN